MSKFENQSEQTNIEHIVVKQNKRRTTWETFRKVRNANTTHKQTWNIVHVGPTKTKPCNKSMKALHDQKKITSKSVRERYKPFFFSLLKI